MAFAHAASFEGTIALNARIDALHHRCFGSKLRIAWIHLWQVDFETTDCYGEKESHYILLGRLPVSESTLCELGQLGNTVSLHIPRVRIFFATTYIFSVLGRS